jgi:hypothetical protein
MNLEDKGVMNITHGIAAVKKRRDSQEIEVLHFCGYFEKPSAEDYEHLLAELTENPEFGLIDEKFELIEAPQDLIDQVKKDYESNISGS